MFEKRFRIIMSLQRRWVAVITLQVIAGITMLVTLASSLYLSATLALISFFLFDKASNKIRDILFRLCRLRSD